MLDFLTVSGTDVVNIPIMSALLTIFISMIMGFVISLTYIKTADNGHYTQNFALTLILLPMVIALIILLIGSNVARAFSLAGAFSIVRFRSAPENPKDVSYVFFSMAAGLACGVGFYLYAIVFTIVLCFIMFILKLVNYAGRKTSQKNLKITIPENLNFEGIFDDILKKYTQSYSLNKIKTIDMGSLFELDYLVTVKNDISQKKFIDELRCKNGNLTITLSLSEDRMDFW